MLSRESTALMTKQRASDALVGDVIVSEEPTALIRHAIRHGCRYVIGREMIAGQAEAIMSFFAVARR